MTTLAPLNRRPEDIRVFAVVVPELKLSDVQMQIFFADLVVRANDATLQDRPEAFDGLSVDCTDNVFMRPMVQLSYADCRFQRDGYIRATRRCKLS
jgi:hypothetical protein